MKLYKKLTPDVIMDYLDGETQLRHTYCGGRVYIHRPDELKLVGEDTPYIECNPDWVKAVTTCGKRIAESDWSFRAREVLELNRLLAEDGNKGFFGINPDMDRFQYVLAYPLENWAPQLPKAKELLKESDYALLVHQSILGICEKLTLEPDRSCEAYAPQLKQIARGEGLGAADESEFA